MKGLATTTVDVHRDADTTDVDEYADPVETADPGGPVYAGIPFSIIERTQRIADVTAGSLIPVTVLVGRSGAEHDIRTGDRIEDKKDGTFYAVVQVSHPQNPAMTLDRRYELRRV